MYVPNAINTAYMWLLINAKPYLGVKATLRRITVPWNLGTNWTEFMFYH